MTERAVAVFLIAFLCQYDSPWRIHAAFMLWDAICNSHCECNVSDDRFTEHSTASNSIGDRDRSCHFWRPEHYLNNVHPRPTPPRKKSTEQPNCWKVPCLSQYSQITPRQCVRLLIWVHGRGAYVRTSVSRASEKGTGTWTDRSNHQIFSSPFLLFTPFFYFLWENNYSNSLLTKIYLYQLSLICDNFFFLFWTVNG